MKKTVTLLAFLMVFSMLSVLAKTPPVIVPNHAQARSAIEMKKEQVLKNLSSTPSHFLSKTHQPAVHPNTIVSLMDSIYYWEWDLNTGSWHADPWLKTINITYDVYNNLTGQMDQRYDSIVWNNSSRNTYTYDANGNRISELNQGWDGTAWVNSYLNSYLYDANNNQLSALYQFWDATAWINNNQYLFTYDAQNNRTSMVIQSWDGSMWQNLASYTYSYDLSNNFISQLTQTWDGTTWVNSSQYTYTYDANNNQTSELNEQWDGAAWMNMLYYTFTYDAFNNQTGYLYQVWNGTAWLNSDRGTSVFDVNQNLTSYVTQYFDTNNVWINSYQGTYTYDSNNNNLTEFIQSWDGSTWLNQQLVSSTYDANDFQLSRSRKSWDTYGIDIIGGDSVYYYLHATTGINTPVSSSPVIDLYPNPTSGSFKYKVNDALLNPIADIEILTITGAVLYHQLINIKTTGVDFVAPSGMYFVNITIDGHTKIEKLLIK